MTTKPSKTTTKPKTRSKKAGSNSSTRSTAKVGVVEKTLSVNEQKFVDEYLIDGNATQAAIRAGYASSTAHAKASSWVGKSRNDCPVNKRHLWDAVKTAREAQQKRTEITADRVLLEAWNHLTADPREVTELHVGACRHCYGDGHRFQRTQAEMDFDYETHLSKGKEPEDFDEQGGVGYQASREPLSDCPECAGYGRPMVVLHDTRNISKAAASLFAGVKQTKFGIEVLMHSKDAAMDKLFKHFGLFEEDNKQKTDPLTSLLESIATNNGSTFKPNPVDPEQE